MEQFIWETPEELDQKLAQRNYPYSEKNQKETFNYAGKISIYKRNCELRLNQKIRFETTKDSDKFPCYL